MAKEKFNRPAIKPVVSYLSAPDDLQRQMNKAMDAIDRSPDQSAVFTQYREQAYDNFDNVMRELARTQKHTGWLKDAIPTVAESLAFHIGAASEVLRRYEEEYLVEAKYFLTGSPRVSDRLYVKGLYERQREFADLKTKMENDRAQLITKAVEQGFGGKLKSGAPAGPKNPMG